jgi:hypothetical protein
MNIIATQPRFLQERAEQRGYAYGEVTPCIVEVQDGAILVDVDHPAYPMYPKPGFEDKSIAALHAEAAAKEAAVAKERGAAGPGTELKSLLRMVGITSSPSCSCNARAEDMDSKGMTWCLWNVRTIVGWLKEEADKRKLPFNSLGAGALVYAAVASAAGRLAVKKAAAPFRRSVNAFADTVRPA